MAIPASALVVSLDANDLTLDEMCLFSPDGFDVVVFRQFLVDHTNWTRAEIGRLKVSELKDVVAQIGQQLNAAAVNPST